MFSATDVAQMMWDSDSDDGEMDGGSDVEVDDHVNSFSVLCCRNLIEGGLLVDEHCWTLDKPMASLSTCHLGLWLGWQILLNLVKNHVTVTCQPAAMDRTRLCSFGVHRIRH